MLNVKRKVKPTRRKQVATKGVTTEERDEMFTWWVEHDRNLMDTARKFKRSHTLIYKIREEDKWDERAGKIDAKVKEGVDRKLVAKRISQVELVRRCFFREVKKYLSKPERQVTGSIQSIVATAEYLDEAEGNLPRDPSESAMPEDIKKALSLLGSLSPDDVKRMGDEIAHTKKTLEGNGT